MSTMCIEEFICELSKKFGLNTKKLAALCGYKDQSFRNKINRRSLNLQDIIALSGELNYSVVLIDKNTGNAIYNLGTQECYEHHKEANETDCVQNDEWRRKIEERITKLEETLYGG